MSTSEKLKKLTRQLYPSGRAFTVKKGGTSDRLENALLESEKRAYDDALSILYSILPDNANFTVEDAEKWEHRLGMISNPSVSLSDRMLAIKRKMNHPGDIPARQSWDYLEQSLQAAGFDVYVYDNASATSIFTVLQPSSNTAAQGQQNQGSINQGTVVTAYSSLFSYAVQGMHQGSVNQGGFTYNNKIVNNIDETKDAQFNDGGVWSNVFYIGGPTLGDFANVPTARKDEFRQLILRLKPTQLVGYLLINYV